LPILFPAMGIMFALAGSLMAASVDRCGARAVLARARRLLPALWVLAAVSVPVMLATGWTDPPLGDLLWWLVPLRTPPGGGEYAWSFTVMLWYLVTYLWLVALSPPLLLLYRRWPLVCLAVAAVVPVVVDMGVLAPAGYLSDPAWSVATYGCCWMLGFAHHDGLLRRLPESWFFAAAATLAVTGAAAIFWNGLTTGVFDVNHVPAGRSLWSAAFVLVVLRFQPRLDWLRIRVRLAALVAALNRRAVTIYLWHVPGGIVALLAVETFGLRGPAWWIVLLASVVAMTAVAVLLFGWVEDLSAARRPRLRPWPVRVDHTGSNPVAARR
jgi:peptidoglycan/LPS O-acetylase OafA/YrhL